MTFGVTVFGGLAPAADKVLTAIGKATALRRGTASSVELANVRRSVAVAVAAGVGGQLLQQYSADYDGLSAAAAADASAPRSKRRRTTPAAAGAAGMDTEGGRQSAPSAASGEGEAAGAAMDS